VTRANIGPPSYVTQSPVLVKVAWYVDNATDCGAGAAFRKVTVPRMQDR